MKDNLLKVINNYLLLFPQEQQRQVALIDYLNEHKDNELIIMSGNVDDVLIKLKGGK